MKNCIAIILFFLFLIFIPSRGILADTTLSISHIPRNLDGFINLRNKIAVTRQGGAAMFILAMIIYSRDKDLGMQCFTIALDLSKLTRSNPVYKGYSPANFRYWAQKLDQMPFLGAINIQGTSYLNGYKLPVSGPYRIAWSLNKINPDKVMIQNTGGNYPRPMLMRRNDGGLWKVVEFSSFFVGPSRMPKKPDGDNL